MTTDFTDHPPKYLCAAARAVWCAGMAKAKEHGSWDDLSQIALEAIAMGAAAYLQAAAAPERTEFSEDLRRRLRTAMVDWDLLAADNIDAGHFTPDGLDADIARLCDATIH